MRPWLLCTLAYGQKYCQGSLTLTSPQGQIQSQSLSESRYNNLLACKWIIQASKTRIILLNISSFNTECGYDYLNIYDGALDARKQVASLCGNRSHLGDQMVFYSSGDIMTITFSTDEQATGKGFLAEYSTIEKTLVCSNKRECNDNGICHNGICLCDGTHNGIRCESKSSGYSPRERHSSAYSAELDVLLISFGKDYNGILPDIIMYNFTTSAWLGLEGLDMEVGKRESVLMYYSLILATPILAGGSVQN
jgi:hypothetical protein